MNCRRPSFGQLILAAALVVIGLPDEGWGDENDDLALIPQAVQDTAAAGTAAISHGKLFIEEMAAADSRRDRLPVAYPAPGPADWQNQTRLDAFYQWPLGSDLSLTLSDRMNVIEASDIDMPSHAMLRNDFREGYVTWAVAAPYFLEAGRINQRGGVALGFNPTDYFSPNTQVALASLDPSQAREDRLGTAMLRGQATWAGGALTVAFAPKLADPVAISSGGSQSFDPGFARTNATDRVMVALSADALQLSPRVSIYRAGAQTRYGLETSHPFGRSVVAYAEWAGGRQLPLIAEALDFGKETGQIPEFAPAPIPSANTRAFRNDLAIGGSWSSQNRMTINVEYHYHQAGLGSQDWRNWFAVGQAAMFSGIARELWYIRSFANAQQQPATRQQAFLRVDWLDAFVPHLELTALSFVDLHDASSLTQVSAKYFLSDRVTLGGYLTANLGRRQSGYGSFPQSINAVAQLDLYL